MKYNIVYADLPWQYRQNKGQEMVRNLWVILKSIFYFVQPAPYMWSVYRCYKEKLYRNP